MVLTIHIRLPADSMPQKRLTLKTEGKELEIAHGGDGYVANRQAFSRSFFFSFVRSILKDQRS